MGNPSIPMTMSSWWVNRQQGLQPMRLLEHYKNGRRKPTIESNGDVKTFIVKPWSMLVVEAIKILVA